NHTWLSLIPPKHPPYLWVTSLYVGGLTLVLALAAMGFRGGPAGRASLAAGAVLKRLARVGGSQDPTWVARCLPALGAQVGRPRPGRHGGDPVRRPPPRRRWRPVLVDGDCAARLQGVPLPEQAADLHLPGARGPRRRRLGPRGRRPSRPGDGLGRLLARPRA